MRRVLNFFGEIKKQLKMLITGSLIPTSTPKEIFSIIPLPSSLLLQPATPQHLFLKDLCYPGKQALILVTILQLAGLIIILLITVHLANIILRIREKQLIITV